jgi:hypothetical protein
MQKPAYPTDSLARNGEKWPKFDMLPCEQLRGVFNLRQTKLPKWHNESTTNKQTALFSPQIYLGVFPNLLIFSTLKESVASHPIVGTPFATLSRSMRYVDFVIPAQAGSHRIYVFADSCFHRNDRVLIAKGLEHGQNHWNRFGDNILGSRRDGRLGAEDLD